MKSWSQASPYGSVTVVVTDVGLHEVSLPGDDRPDVPLGTPDRHIARQHRAVALKARAGVNVQPER